LNKATHKGHFPLPVIDQMLERLANNSYFCYLDGYSGFFQIPIHPNDQEKTTLHALMVHMLMEGCHLGYAMPLLHFNAA